MSLPPRKPSYARRRASLRARLGQVAAVLGLAGLLGGMFGAVAPAEPAAAVTGAEFNPGLIITDQLFYDGAAMTAAEIQAFLESKVPSCWSNDCLTVINVNIPDQPQRWSSTGILNCQAMPGGTMRASELLYRAQVACGISAKVLLVTLQKEQSLVTSRDPSDYALRWALGFACPDTAPCDDSFSGLASQIYAGAVQLKAYRNAPGVNFKVGSRSIQWSPNAACGSSVVNIQSWGTAALYNYTPYQPNAAALANLYGTGDACSAYGNRNFWTYYSDWFGSTMGTLPYNVLGPWVAGGSALGSTLQAQGGTWSGSPSFAYLWLRCETQPPSTFAGVPSMCAPITGASGLSYQTVEADLGKWIALLVTGTNAYGSYYAGAVMDGPVGKPENSVAPKVTGLPDVGKTWTLDIGTWIGSTTTAIFWLRCENPVATAFAAVPSGCSAISGANGTTYVTTTADRGKYLTAQVAGSNTYGFALAGAVSTAQIGFPINSSPPTVSGVPDVGRVWTATAGTWSGSPTLGFFWLRCDLPITVTFTAAPAGCAAIPGANAATYTATAADLGKYLTVQIAATADPMGFALAGAVSNVRIGFPFNLFAPSVSGNAAVGAIWSIDPGAWTGSATLTLFWVRCDQPVTAVFATLPAGCSAIPGANGTTYTTTTADVGKYVTAQVAGTNSMGFALAGAVSTTPIAAAVVPVNTVAPSVSGASQVGATWTLNTGTWTGSPAPTFGIYWLRCNQPVPTPFTAVPAGCAAISGANATTYVVTSADAGKYLTAQIAGSNALGFSLAGALSVTPIAAAGPTAPINAVAPTVSGAATVGAVWTATAGTWTGSPAPSLSYHWLRCSSPIASPFTTYPASCTPITGASAATYTATSADLGRYLTVQLAGTNSSGYALAGAASGASSIASDSASLPASTVAPTVSGAATVGAVWTATAGTWTGSPTPILSYYWLRCSSPVASPFTSYPASCTPIAGANSSTYTATSADSGKYLTVQLAGVNASGFALAGAVSTTAIQASTQPANTLAPTVSGTPLTGSAWTATAGTWTGSPTPNLSYYWLRCSSPVASPFTSYPASCTPIAGANSSTYTATSADSGKYLTVQLAGVNASGFALAGAVSTTAIQATALPANSIAPTVSGTAAVGSTWMVNVGTWTGYPAPTMIIYWLRCDQPIGTGYTTVPAGCSAIAGANSAAYVATSADLGKYLTAQVAGANAAGFALAGAVSTAAIGPA